MCQVAVYLERNFNPELFGHWPTTQTRQNSPKRALFEKNLNIFLPTILKDNKQNNKQG